MKNSTKIHILLIVFIILSIVILTREEVKLNKQVVLSDDFKELWEQAINITDIEQIRMLYQKFESSFDEEEKKQLQEKIDQIRTKGIMSDV